MSRTEGASADDLFPTMATEPQRPREVTYSVTEANEAERAGWAVIEREQFGTRYWYLYPPGFTHTHGPRCVGTCSVPSRFVRSN